VVQLMPQLGVLQSEVGGMVMDMVKAHKTYTMDEAAAHDARLKESQTQDK
jgi:hypothetical protein